MGFSLAVFSCYLGFVKAMTGSNGGTAGNLVDGATSALVEQVIIVVNRLSCYGYLLVIIHSYNGNYGRRGYQCFGDKGYILVDSHFLVFLHNGILVS